MALTHARFQRLNPRGLQPIGDPVEVMFNPTELAFSKGAQIAEAAIPGLDSPVLQFVRGQTETLTVDLFFDTTDDGTGSTVTPVTRRTDQFYALVKIDRTLHAPPICRFSWGGAGSFPGAQLDPSTPGAGGGATAGGERQRRTNGFTCVVDKVAQRFTMFSPAGVPLRATLNVSLREYKTLSQQVQELGLMSADHTRVRVVQHGDTLAGIAGSAYDDPGSWRLVADANGIEDPLELEPGRVLEVPRAPGRGGAP